LVAGKGFPGQPWVGMGGCGAVVRRLLLHNDYITKRNHDSKPFAWTVAANEIITKVRLIHQDFKKLFDNNDNQQ
jgi:hypothetical protein